MFNQFLQKKEPDAMFVDVCFPFSWCKTHTRFFALTVFFDTVVVRTTSTLPPSSMCTAVCHHLDISAPCYSCSSKTARLVRRLFLSLSPFLPFSLSPSLPLSLSLQVVIIAPPCLPCRPPCRLPCPPYLPPCQDTRARPLTSAHRDRHTDHPYLPS